MQRDGHFFGPDPVSLESILRRTPGVTSVQTVVDAYVPIMTVEVGQLICH